MKVNSLTSNPVLLGAAVGVPVGLALTVTLAVTQPWYRHLLVWSWTNPYLLGAGALVGLYLGWKSEQV